MSPETTALGFTGGEPTLLADRFLHLISHCKTHLPGTAVHVLTNGRLFNYLSFAQALGGLGHPDLVLGIPLYSDLAWHHDFIVQAPRAFDQTIRGILNLARCQVRVEIRVVIHRHSVDRLPQLARFIARNLPFVDHVALMGLEPIGFAKSNLEALWIDPVDYQPILDAAVGTLSAHGMSVSIYNHQLCVLPPQLWPFARQSISDWKNVYLAECQDCALREHCGGFFHSAARAHSRAIKPFDRAPSGFVIST
jgi:His-Xaa-Ser system radical SAM maturase HxsC